MRHRLATLATSLALVLWVVGCAEYADRREAEHVLVHHFEALAHRDYDAAMADYDDSFFEDVTRTEWRGMLVSVMDKLGSFKGYDVSAFGLASRRLSGPGTYVRFRCKVSYSKHTSDEILYLFRKQGAAKFKILGHQIDSDGLLIK